MISYYFWILIFAIVTYIIIVDKNVLLWIELTLKLISIQTQRFFWIIRFHPKNPVTNLIKRYEYNKIAKELEKEFKDML